MKLSPSARVAIETQFGEPTAAVAGAFLSIAEKFATSQGSAAERIAGAAFDALDVGLAAFGVQPDSMARAAIGAFRYGVTSLVGSIVGATRTDAKELAVSDKRT